MNHENIVQRVKSGQLASHPSWDQHYDRCIAMNLDRFERCLQMLSIKEIY